MAINLLPLRSLPKGLTFDEAARRMGIPYRRACYLMHKGGYAALDGRRFGQRKNRKLVPEKVNWKLPNTEIARQFKVSRERVRQARERLGKKAVENRGRKPNNRRHANA